MPLLQLVRAAHAAALVVAELEAERLQQRLLQLPNFRMALHVSAHFLDRQVFGMVAVAVTLMFLINRGPRPLWLIGGQITLSRTPDASPPVDRDNS